jgi:hypothetical protein
MLITYNGGWSSYNALTAKSNGVSRAACTYWVPIRGRKVSTSAPPTSSPTISTEYKKWDKGRSTFDVPHRFVSSFAYELPFVRGKKYGAGMNKVADLLVGGCRPTAS